MAINLAPNSHKSAESELYEMHKALRLLVQRKDAAHNTSDYETILTSIWELQAKMKPLQQQVNRELALAIHDE